MEAQELQEKLEAYLTGTMSEEERQDFEVFAEGSEECQELLKLHSEVDRVLFPTDEILATDSATKTKVLEYLNSDDAKEFGAILDRQKGSTRTVTKKQSPRIGQWIGAAAAIGLLLLSIAFWPSSQSKLFYEYAGYEDLPSMTQRSTENDLSKIESEFKNENYESVLELINDVPVNEKHPNVFLYESLALAEKGQFDQAHNRIDEFIGSEFMDAEQGYYYKALLFVKQKENNKAKDILSDIVEQGMPFQQEASELLKRLK